MTMKNLIMTANTKIVLASNNSGKLTEFQHFFDAAHLKVNLISQSQFSIPSIEETGTTFVENAIQKARHAALHSQLPAIADDSGLEVDALKGAPGIYSARYAGENADAHMRIRKLLQALTGVPEEKRTARFQCLLVYLKHAADPTPLICQGTWEGFILTEPRGQQGFGYDPIFYVPTHQCSAGELPLAVKNQISHRAMALQQLVFSCLT